MDQPRGRKDWISNVAAILVLLCVLGGLFAVSKWLNAPEERPRDTRLDSVRPGMTKPQVDQLFGSSGNCSQYGPSEGMCVYADAARVDFHYGVVKSSTQFPTDENYIP